jgi:diadenylate cyclase
VDAAVVVVSEERGEMALAVGGRLHRPLDAASLRRFLRRLYVPVGRTKPDKAAASASPAEAPLPAPAPGRSS